MKVRQLTKVTTIDIPDEWGEVVNRLKEIIPEIRKAANTDNSVHVSLSADGSFSVTINDYNKAGAGEKWTSFSEYVAEDGGGFTYASEYVKGGE